MGVIISTITIMAQNYKAPKIDASGKVWVNDKHVGNISKEGVITDQAGIKLAHVGSDGELMDATTGKKLGLAAKNGNYTPHFSNGQSDEWTISEPDKEGMCEVKDKSGKVVGVVHENYKQQGACAIHCLTMKKEHAKAKEKEHEKK